MARVYDYNSFSSNKIGSERGAYTFGCELKYIDIDIHNRPDEYANISDSKVFVEYSVNLDIRKAGIDAVNFSINTIELEFSVDDHPNPIKEFDIDLTPGSTIDIGQVMADVKNSPIPTDPTGIKIDMNGSTDSKKFNVYVSFGKD